MELVNTTALPALLRVSEIDADPSGKSVRLGTLVAKATFDVKPSGGLELSDAPLPVFEMEEPTELGIMPRDVVPPRPEGLELMVLAAAHAPGGRPVQQMTVALRFGDQRRELLVTGDRTWVEAEGAWAMTEPLPFTRMPLSWSRTFGGTAEVWIDAASPVDVRHPYNAAGRGFDPTSHARGIEHSFGCPEGFPRIVHDWAAPNVEDPAHPVREREDEPEPRCWAPMPLELGLRLKPAVDAHLAGARGPEEPSFARLERARREGEAAGTLFFAPPDLRVPVPEPRTPIVLCGCRPEGNWGFGWPGLGVVADYVLGERTGVRPLSAQAALLLPEEGRVAITYRCWFRFVVEDPGIERSIRLRLVD